MRQRQGAASASSKPSSTGEVTETSSRDNGAKTNVFVTMPKRSPAAWLVFLVVMMYSSWSVYRYQYENLPAPMTAERAGKRGFSEVEAMKHVKALTELGPHPVGSPALGRALKYVLAVSEEIKKTAHWEVDVEVDYFHVNSGANNINSGLFKGRTLAYSDLSHVVLRILPKFSTDAEDNAILISSHIDTVFSTEGAGDCSSCVAVMLELARGVSQWAHGFKNAVIFLFNTGEEEGLSGAHSFITQHRLNATIRLAIDLEAMGIGGKSAIFQAGPDPWAIENFALVAKYPSGQIISQDVFSSGAIKSATDFQIYREVAGLSGLDFAYVDKSAVYHTKNDKLELLNPGSLQHLGDNMLAFLLQTATSSSLPGRNGVKEKDGAGKDSAIYFDILGTYMVVYRQSFASMLHSSIILQSLLIWATSLVMGGFSAAASLALSCLSVVLMWVFSLGFSLLVAFVLPLLSPSPVPYIGSPWLVIGLFGAPAFLGALFGQHLGYLILQTYLLKAYSNREQLSSISQAYLAKLEAERWLYKGGLVQWFILLILGNYYKIGSTFMALVWLVPPAFTYGLLEATLSPMRLPRPLKLATLLIGLAAPILLSSGFFIRLAGTLIAILVRFDRNPGSTPDWLGNLIISVFIAATICLTLVYLLSYIHLAGAKKIVALGTFFVFGFTLLIVLSGAVQPFTEDTSRAVNVVHVVDARGQFGEQHVPSSYVSLFSTTPGKLTNEIHQIKGFTCGRDKVIDFVTFSVKYGCWYYDETEEGWSKSEIPIMHVDSDASGVERITQVSIDTKGSIRWSLAINTKEIEDFELRGNAEEFVPRGHKSNIDGWHIVQFSGGENAPRKFDLTLYWMKNSTQPAQQIEGQEEPLLKLRTDVDRLTPKVESILSKLPSWCSLFGKSTSPYTLAFLTNLPINFE